MLCSLFVTLLDASSLLYLFPAHYRSPGKACCVVGTMYLYPLYTCSESETSCLKS